MSDNPRETPRLERTRSRGRPGTWVTKPQVGDKLGSFRLLELLGEGGAGVVFRAEHTFLKRPVAIKVLHPELYLRPAMVARFFQEALAVNRARHPNIIDITDVVSAESYPPYIVMEYLAGEDLGDHIDRNAPVPPNRALELVSQICDALAVVHGLGIVHRDLKPENIFLVTKGAGATGDVPKVKLLDFGIAKFLDNEEARRRTWSGNILGTPAYMPLEQLHGLPVDHRADIYALGVVTYELLTGVLPFDLDTVDDLVECQLAGKPIPPSVRVARLPVEPIRASLDRVVLRCLSDDPTKRYQSVGEYRDALRRAVHRPDETQESIAGAVAAAVEAGEAGEAGQLEGSAAGSTPEPAARSGTSSLSTATTEDMPLPAGDARRPGRRLLLAAIGGVATLVLLLGIAFWGGSHRSTEQDPRTPRAGAPAATEMHLAGHTERQVLSVPDRAEVRRLDDGRVLGSTPLAVQVGEDRPLALELRLAGHRATRVVIHHDDPDPVRVTLPSLDRAVAGDAAPGDGASRDAPQGRPGAGRHPSAAGGPGQDGPMPRAGRLAPSPRRPAARRASPMRRGAPRGMRRVTEKGIVDPFHK